MRKGYLREQFRRSWCEETPSAPHLVHLFVVTAFADASSGSFDRCLRGATSVLFVRRLEHFALSLQERRMLGLRQLELTVVGADSFHTQFLGVHFERPFEMGHCSVVELVLLSDSHGCRLFVRVFSVSIYSHSICLHDRVVREVKPCFLLLFLVLEVSFVLLNLLLAVQNESWQRSRLELRWKLCRHILVGLFWFTRCHRRWMRGILVSFRLASRCNWKLLWISVAEIANQVFSTNDYGSTLSIWGVVLSRLVPLCWVVSSLRSQCTPSGVVDCHFQSLHFAPIVLLKYLDRAIIFQQIPVCFWFGIA